MTKTVVSTGMVAHLWVHQSQDRATNAGRSFSFDGPVCYSYRTPIAMVHETKLGRVALVTSERYTMTTSSKHMPAVRRALHDVARPYSVPYVGAFGGRAPSRSQKPEEWHAVNIAHLVAEYNTLGGRFRRAVYSYHSSVDNVIVALNDTAQIVRDYCDSFALACPVIDVEDDARVIWRARCIREEKRTDPVEIARRTRNAERADERRLEREAAALVEQFERDTVSREAFRAGGRPGYGVRDEQGGALLRVNGDKVQTSLGAEIPADDARRVFPLIARIRGTGKEWIPVEPVKLGSFALSVVHSDGSIRAGCHTINWPEIELCARALGLLE